MLTELVLVAVAAFITGSASTAVLMSAKRKRAPQPEHSFIGQAARVIQRIDNRTDSGQVRLHGMEWTARSLDGEAIEEGASVRVIEIDGVKLIVDREEEMGT